MLATSRESRASLRDALDERREAGDIADASEQFLAVAALLHREKSLRAMLADSGQPASVRSGLVERLLGQRLGETALALIGNAVSKRWSTARDLVDSIEALGAQAAFMVAQSDGSLDSVEDELFRFGRAVDASSELQMALTSPAMPAAEKAGIVGRLLEGRCTPITHRIVEHVVLNLRGRRLDAALTSMVNLAAAQRNRIVAIVRVAGPISAEQQERLTASLRRITGREVRINVVIDPEVIGGMSVRIGDDLIDGTIASRLEQAHRAVVGG
jgi:F-type H+-transporting ATPase subunit delta